MPLCRPQWQHPQAKRPYLRPGIPAETPLSCYPDRASPPVRADDADGHYVFELGENLSSRCGSHACAAGSQQLRQPARATTAPAPPPAWTRRLTGPRSCVLYADKILSKMGEGEQRSFMLPREFRQGVEARQQHV